MSDSTLKNDPIVREAMEEFDKALSDPDVCRRLCGLKTAYPGYQQSTEAIHVLDKPDSARVEFWQRFSLLVEDHIRNYTIPQYGDWPTDMLSSYTEEQLFQQILKYVTRQVRGTSRGWDSDLQDLFKIAHYTQTIATNRLRAKEEEEKSDGS